MDVALCFSAPQPQIKKAASAWPRLENIDQAPREGSPGAVLQHVIAPGRCHLERGFRISEGLANGTSQGGGIVGWNQEPGHTVFDRLGKPTHIGGHDGASKALRRRGRTARGGISIWEYNNIGHPEQRCHIGVRHVVEMQRHLVGDPQCLNLLVQGLRAEGLGRIAGNDEAKAGSVWQPRKPIDQVCYALARAEQTEEQTTFSPD